VRLVARSYARRPFLTTWGVLAAGMAVMVILFGLDAGMAFRHHATLVLVAAGLAWLCTWIIFLEDSASHDPS
jgi:hypothetical protein